MNPKGNIENLIVPSPVEARKNGSKGGKEKGKKQGVRECLEMLLERPASEAELAALAEQLGIQPKKRTLKGMVLAAALYRKAAAGDMTALKTLLDLTGEKEEKPDCEIVIRLEGELKEYGG